MRVIRWGILGAGRIAGTVAQAISACDGAELYAVASRSPEKAEKFKNAHSAKKAYGSYRELVEDASVDIVYIATPHAQHKEHAQLSIQAGKNVLCEKPLAPNEKQAKEMISLAREKQVFLMEAMWTKFLPAVQTAVKWVKDGKIGEPRMLEAGFCFRSEIDAGDRLYNPALAGGALLDVGVYPLHMASLIFGAHPKEIRGSAYLGGTGVDEQGAALLQYENGALANLSFAIRTDALNDAVIYGTQGTVRIPSFWKAESAELWKDGVCTEKQERPFMKNGYEYEIMEVCSCLRNGKCGSEIAAVEDTAAILAICDALRASWGERYPFE